MGFFNFFSKKPSPGIVDFNTIKVDFHSHLVPNVDDGVKTIEETAVILDFFISKGYKKIYTSPHIMGEGYTNTKAGLTQAFEELKQHETIKNKAIEFNLIAEYFMDEEFEKLIETDELLTFSGNRILIETSMNYEFPNFKGIIYKLINKNYKPILAHPERYNFINSQKDCLEYYEQLKDMGVEFQLNMFSLVGLYGQNVRKTAEKLIDHELIDYISSDIHSSKQLDFFEELKYSEYLHKLITSNLLKNNSL